MVHLLKAVHRDLEYQQGIDFSVVKLDFLTK